MIPGKWSDFDGWNHNWEEKKKEFTLLLQLEKSTLEVIYMTEIKNAIGYLAFAMVLCMGLGLFLLSHKSMLS